MYKSVSAQPLPWIGPPTPLECAPNGSAGGSSMRALMATGGALIFAAGFASGGRCAGAALEPGGSQSRWTVAPPPPRSSGRHFISGSRGQGVRERAQWQIFLRDEVPRQFPEGLTVWARGGPVAGGRRQVSITNSRRSCSTPRSAAARQSFQAVIEAYRKTFEQQSVLWESARVCVAA